MLPSWPLDPPAAAPARPLSSTPPPPRAGDAFFCRHCRRSVVAPEPPRGWFRVQQRDPDPNRYSSRLYGTLGLFCTLDCLIAAATGWAAQPRQQQEAPDG